MNQFYIKLFFIIIVSCAVSQVLAQTLATPEKQTMKTQQTDNKQPEKTPKRKDALKKFIPSEKINADSSISFPVDI